jgi:hypothetical protein
MEKCPAFLTERADACLGLIAQSYERLTADKLVADNNELVEALWSVVQSSLFSHHAEPPK